MLDFETVKKLAELDDHDRCDLNGDWNEFFLGVWKEIRKYRKGGAVVLVVSELAKTALYWMEQAVGTYPSIPSLTHAGPKDGPPGRFAEGREEGGEEVQRYATDPTMTYEVVNGELVWKKKEER